MNIDELMASDKSATSKGTLIGQAIRRHEFDWLDKEIIGEFPIIEKVYLYSKSLALRPLCKCGKPLKFLRLSDGYRTACSLSCAKKLSFNYEKSKAYFLKKHGVENPLLLESSKLKAKLAAQSKSGKPMPESQKAASKATLKLNHGVENISQLPMVRAKITETMNERYGSYWISSETANKERQEKWLTKTLTVLQDVHHLELLAPFISSKALVSAKCLDCKTEFKLSLSNGHVGKCPKCYFKPANKSLKEAELSKFVVSLGETVITNVKSKDLIYPYSLDVYVPEKKIAIEFNGDYWHNENFVGKDYHLNKLELCKTKGISLIQIFEHEWDNQRKLIEARLKTILGHQSIKIGARSCELSTNIDSKNERKFLDENHLQGYIPSSNRVGLYYNNELVALATMGRPRFNKQADKELLRFATKSGIVIPGGGSKLLKALTNDFTGSLISYRDRRWGNSNFYQSLGFELQGISSPGYVYSRAGTIISRYQAQKKKIAILLGDKFDESLTETENMTKARFNKLWDCGQEVYVKHIEYK